MRRFLEITLSSFKIALQELWKNKLRTFLSLFGVTIGIFCIISVLATVSSLQKNIQTEIKALGNNTIYIDKWNYSGDEGDGDDFPWWKYQKRPTPKMNELEEVKKRTTTAEFAAYVLRSFGPVEYADNMIKAVNIYGFTEDFSKIQPTEIQAGRAFNTSDFALGNNLVLIGNEIAVDLYGEPVRAVGKTIKVKNRQSIIVGVIKKQGNQIVGGWNFDKSVLMTYHYARTVIDENHSDPLILIKGKENITSKVLKDELKGTMRSVRKLSPVQEDNFSLNDINDISDALGQAFVSVNIGGWAIGVLSFIVGIFGVANIMFVTVKERTSQIGLKKALGAKKNVILMEFLLESAFLTIIGGIIGLLLVFILTTVVSGLLHFPIFLSPGIILLAILICIAAGIIAGIIPATRAANMDPVAAIRTT